MHILSKLVKNELVKGLANIVFKKKKLCGTHQIRKQVKTFFKGKNHISTKRTLELQHIDLFGPTRTRSISGKWYIFF